MRRGVMVGGGTALVFSLVFGMGAIEAGAAPTPGTINAFAGTGASGATGDGGPATSATMTTPSDAVTAAGSTYIADTGNCLVRKVATDGTISTFAGTVCGTPAGDGGPATSATLGAVTGVAVDSAGNVYIADNGNNQIREVATDGTISTFAGTGTPGYMGDGAAATAAELNGPYGVRVDSAGDVIFSDRNNHVIREVDTGGIITTVAGTGTIGYMGDGGPATAAELDFPAGLSIDAAGNVFFADEGNFVIREFSIGGNITTVAGDGTSGTSGDGGPATSAELSDPFGVAVDASGNLYIADFGGNSVRKVTAADGTISTYAGTSGTPGDTGNGGPASAALLEGPASVSLDSAGNLYITDFTDNTVRVVALASPPPPPPVSTGGYWMVASDGGIFNFGSAGFLGSRGGQPLNKPIVGMAATPDNKGYWLVATDGGIFSYGDAAFFGSTGSIALNKPIVGMAATADGKGYWLVASDGGIFNYGDAGFFGSAGSLHLNQPIVGMAATPDGKGYWLVASDGGIFTYGDATFLGSTGSIKLNKPVVGMAATPDGKGYWLVATDGGIFSYGDAAFFGSTGSIKLNKPVVGMAAAPDGKGYWLVATDGGIFNYGSAGFFGSTGSIKLNQPVVGMAAAS